MAADMLKSLTGAFRPPSLSERLGVAESLHDGPATDRAPSSPRHGAPTAPILAFFIECACPAGLREASVAGGDLSSPDDFLDDYHLTHIECQTCHRYYRLVGYIDENGHQHEVDRSR